MDLSFANPLALWALAGLPAVVLLHFLQSKNRTARISTLFLLEHLQQDTRRGAVITRLRTGWQFWLQLLAVLLLTLLLSQPRVLREESVQDVALIVDSSSSMQAFSDEILQEMDTVLERVGGIAHDTQWWILPSDETLPRLAAAASPEDVAEAVGETEFSSGVHDPSPRFREARSIVGPEGLVVYLTDHADREVSPGVAVVAIGRSLSNAGVTGLQFIDSPDEDVRWQVSVVNRSAEPMTRSLQVVDRTGVEVSRSTIELPPEGIRTLEGLLPPEVMQGRIRLLPLDGFPRDDEIPFVRPAPKQLRVTSRMSAPALQVWSQRIASTVPGADLGSQGDVFFRGETGPVPSGVSGEVVLRQGDAVAPYRRILPAKHPLVASLDWDSLLVQPFSDLIGQSSDTVLLRMGSVPLILLRPRTGGSTLIFNFDPESGNGLRHAGLALLVYRYLTAVQSELEVPFSSNFLAGQSVELPELDFRFEPLSGDTTRSFTSGGQLPNEAGWLTGLRDGVVQIRIATTYDDLEEGDFRSASSKELPEDLLAKQRRQHEEADLLLPLWMSLLGLTVVGSWWAGAERRART